MINYYLLIFYPKKFIIYVNGAKQPKEFPDTWFTHHQKPTDNLPERTDNLPDPTDNLPEPKDNLSQYRQHKFYKFHNVDQI